jgi:hypothetical protein
MYIHTYIYIYIHIYVYTYIYVCIYMYMCILIHMDATSEHQPRPNNYDILISSTIIFICIKTFITDKLYTTADYSYKRYINLSTLASCITIFYGLIFHQSKHTVSPTFKTISPFVKMKAIY